MQGDFAKLLEGEDATTPLLKTDESVAKAEATFMEKMFGKEIDKVTYILLFIYTKIDIISINI